MRTIYISGKISGCDPRDVADKFNMAEYRLEKRFGYIDENRHRIYPKIIMPTSIADIPNGSWQDYIERDLIYLKHCDTIYMLKDWKDSPGARVELEFAKKLGLEIIYETDGSTLHTLLSHETEEDKSPAIQ